VILPPTRINWLRRSLIAAALVATILPGVITVGAEDSLPPVTSTSGSPRLPGKFIWADLVTDDVRTVRGFYYELFHWQFQERGDYTIGFNNDRPLCGLIQRARPPENPEAHPRWFGYISVSNVQRAQKAATKAGGRVLAEAKKFPKRGEQAVFTDPEGAIFGVLKSSSGDIEDFLAAPGDWIWIQLLSRDAKKASEFYSAVAGYEVVPNANPKGLSDYILTSEGYARATVRTLATADPKVRPSWLPFVRVEHIAQTLKRTGELGGKVLIEPKPELLNGKVAVIADPTGAMIGVLEWDETMVKGGAK
jgi:predicted enzyme related to lactoylglutathione lyase